MRKEVKVKRVVSEATRAKMSLAAQSRGKVRSEALQTAVLAVMEEITAEVNANGGRYLGDGGEVTMLEIANRAGISETAFYTSAQREFGIDVKRFVDSFKPTPLEEAAADVRDKTGRSDDWKVMFEQLQDAQRLIELDLQQAEADRDEALVHVERLKAENERLRRLLYPQGDAVSNVSPIQTI